MSALRCSSVLVDHPASFFRKSYNSRLAFANQRKTFRYSLAIFFCMSERKLQRHRWYFFEIFLRSLEEAQWSFVGKMVAEDEREDKLVLQDQDDDLYFLRLIYDTYIDGDFVRIRSERAGSGQTVDEGWLKEIGEEDFQPREVLTKLKEKPA